MKCNVGKADRVIRIILAVIIGALGIYFKSWFGLIALIPLATAIISFCPIWSILGVSTCGEKTNNKAQESNQNA